MANVKVTVAIADTHLDHVLDVAQSLRAAGLKVDQIMDAIGVITGSCESGQVSDLSKVAGVARVEKAQEFKLPPPNSPIQ